MCTINKYVPIRKKSGNLFNDRRMLRKFIFVNPLPFELKFIIKDPLFITCSDILEKWLISLCGKTCRYVYAIKFILLIKSRRKPNAQLAHFSYLF